MSDNWLEYPTEALSVKIPLINPDTTIGEALDWEIIDTSASYKKAIFHYLEENNLLDKIDVDFNIEFLNDLLFYEFEEFHDNKGLPSNKITKYKNDNHCEEGEGEAA
ncbi:hypothetical protein CDG77_09340, partial [Nostoc sp. 'Peltigera membranacea cyanobiont' 213]|uniref:hypothetical protein n=1 Tax=Nostoc sp. 'Peltigera membranacea cyanobiont' 213 TaxID=2014530 RepID=UPI000B9F3391